MGNIRGCVVEMDIFKINGGDDDIEDSKLFIKYPFQDTDNSRGTFRS